MPFVFSRDGAAGKDAKGVRLTTESIKRLCFQVLDIFDHIYSKDRFMEMYKFKMQDRLLNPSYKEYGLEAEVLSRLKLKMGQVSQMELMLKDVKLVKDVRHEWDAYLQGTAIATGESVMKVRACWEVYIYSTFKLKLTV